LLICCSGDESGEVTNDEIVDAQSRGIVGRGGSQPVMSRVDSTAGDMSDDLYSEITSRDTEQLLKPRVTAKTRRSAAANSE